MFRLETDRLLVRPWQVSDRPTFVSLMQDHEVTRHIHGGVPYTEEETDEFFSRQARQLADLDMCMGALTEKATDRVIGIAGLQPLGTTGNLEIGWILERQAWGLGYASEVGRASMNYVLQTLGRPRVVAIIDVENEPSKRVASRLGMQYDRRFTGVELGHRKPGIVVDLYFRES